MTNKTLEFLLALVYFIISLIPLVSSIVLIFLCTIYIKLLSIYLSRKHKTKIQLINGLDGLFALSEQKVECVNNAVFVFEGKPQIERIKESVRVQWTDVKDNGVYAYPKLRCAIAKASGYFYWLPERKFSLDDHVKVYKCAPPRNDTQYHDAMTAVCNSPISDEISQWMIHVIPLSEDYERFAGKPHYALVMRIHHCIGDGFSCVMMTGDCLLDEKTVKLLNPKEIPKVSILERILVHLGTFFYIPLFVVWSLLRQDLNVLHGPNQVGERLLRFSENIPLDRIKRVGKFTNTTVNDVMTSIVTGVLGRFYEKLGSKPSKPVQAYLPISLHTSIQKGFHNKSSSFVINLPLDANYGLFERLERVHEAINEQKWSFFYRSVHFVQKWTVNQLPSVFSKLFVHFSGATLVLTNLPGYQSQSYSRFGEKMKFCSAFPTHIFKQNLGFAITSTNGSVNIAMSVDKSVVDSVKSVEWFLAMCIEEFESLERMCG